MTAHKIMKLLLQRSYIPLLLPDLRVNAMCISDVISVTFPSPLHSLFLFPHLLQ